MTGERRLVAFDSNVLTYFLDGNRGSYALILDDPLGPQRIAAVRLFLYCTPLIMPTVKREASQILEPTKLDEHLRFIDFHFGEFDPDRHQREQIEIRAKALHQHHRGLDDCRILAEVECNPAIPVLVTFDYGLQDDLRAHSSVRIEAPDECWASFDLPRGCPPQWSPGRGHPLEHQQWWRW